MSMQAKQNRKEEMTTYCQNLQFWLCCLQVEAVALGLVILWKQKFFFRGRADFRCPLSSPEPSSSFWVLLLFSSPLLHSRSRNRVSHTCFFSSPLSSPPFLNAVQHPENEVFPEGSLDDIAECCIVLFFFRTVIPLKSHFLVNWSRGFLQRSANLTSFLFAPWYTKIIHLEQQQWLRTRIIN